MKKMLALFLSFVIVFAFAGCSSELSSVSSELPESSESSVSSEPAKHDVFKDINEKSKQFTYLDIDFDSIKANDEDGSLSLYTQTSNGWSIFVFYDDSENYKINHISIVSTGTEKNETEFMDVCKSVLLIDEWGLTPEDIKNLPLKGTIEIHSPLVGDLRVMMNSNLSCHVMLDVY